MLACEYLPQTQTDLAMFIVIITSVILLMKVYFRKASKQSRNHSHDSEAFEKAKDLPGPLSWPVFGNCFQMQQEAHLTLDAWSRRYGPVYTIKLGTHPVVVLNDMATIKEALNRYRDIFSGRPRFSSSKLVSFGRGVAFNDRSTMDDWYQRKEMMMTKLNSFVVSASERKILESSIEEEATFITSTIMQKCRESPSGYTDPSEVIKASIGNAMCAVCFGRRFDINDAKFIQLLSMNKEFGDVAGVGNRIDMMPWMKIFPVYQKAAADFAALSSRIQNWVLDRVKEDIENYDPTKTRNVVDSLLHNAWSDKLKPGAVNGQTKGGLSLLEFAAIFVDIFGAGQDTLVNASLFTLYYMLKHPEVAKQVREELDRVVGPHRLPALSDRPQLPYLRAVVHEVFRHSSLSAVTIPHRTLDKCVLQGYKVPAEVTVFLNFYTANHDPRIWIRPNDFNPNRFLSTSLEGKLKLDLAKTKQYTVFSAGARKCPGYEMSYSWLTLASAILMHRYEFQADPEHPPTEPRTNGLTLRPVAFQMKLVPRCYGRNGNSVQA